MIVTNRVQIDAIQTDANYNNGNYHRGRHPDTGVAIARMIGFTTFISPQMMEKKFAKAHQSIREPFRDRYFKEQMFHEAEQYLRKQAEPFSENFDANSMVYLLQTWNHFDLARRYGTLAKAVEPIKAPVMLIAATGDNLFPPYLNEDVVMAMEVHGKTVRLELIDDDYGHDFFLIPEIITKKIAPPLAEFLRD
jgi:homoserine O-acetyltransferase